MKSIVDKHIAACLVELRAQVEREFAQAIQGLTRAGEISSKSRRAAVPQERARKAKAATSAPKAKDRVAGKREAVSEKPAPVGVILNRPCGCSPRGRHRRECAGAQPPRTVERSPRVERAATTTDSPRVKAPIDVVKAERFARLEAAAQKRTGAAA